MKNIILILSLLCGVSHAQRVSDLPPAGTIAGTDIFLDVQNWTGGNTGTSTKATADQLKTYFTAGVPLQLNPAAGSNITITGTYPDLTWAVSGLAAVATSGSYNDLANKPTIPTNNNQLANGANYITSSGAPVQSVFGRTGAVTPSQAELTAILGSAYQVPGTTLASYGITDAYTKTASDARYQPLSSTLTSLASGTPITAGTNITVTGTWPAITINAASNSQVNSDWNASSGVAQILNKPTIPTVPAYGTTAGTVAQGNDSRITGALQTSALGTGVQTALGNATNTASGVVTVNSSGYAAPNVNFTRGGFLLIGNKGGFLTGNERAVLSYSTDGVTFTHVPGIEKVTPHVAGDGFRDPTIIRSGTKYLMAALCSKSGGTETYFEVQSSTDLVNWTFVADVSGAAGNSPKWFLDPPTGNLYLVISGGGSPQVVRNTSTTGGYPDGVSWGSVNVLSFTGSSTAADSCLVYRNGTYYLFYVQNSPSAYLQYYATSSSLLTGYTQIGQISIWQQGEGISIATTPQGTYRAYWHAMTGSSLSGNQTSTSSDLVTWSTPVTVMGLATADTYGSFDNAGAWCFSDVDTWRDVAGAMAQGFSRLIQIDSGSSSAGFINTSAQQGFAGGSIDTSASQTAPGGALSMRGGTGTGGYGGNINTSGGTTGNGGSIDLRGTGTRAGGNITLLASSAANSGSITLSGGAGGSGGTISMSGGSGGGGGNIYAYGGSGSNTAAGNIYVFGGSGSGERGGSIDLSGVSGYRAGSITLSGGTNAITLCYTSFPQPIVSFPALTGNDTFALLGFTQTFTGDKTFSGKVILPTSTPASASATGVTGQIVWDSGFIYICTATNTWKRVAIATW